MYIRTVDTSIGRVSGAYALIALVAFSSALLDVKIPPRWLFVGFMIISLYGMMTTYWAFKFGSLLAPRIPSKNHSLVRALAPHQTYLTINVCKYGEGDYVSMVVVSSKNSEGYIIRTPEPPPEMFYIDKEGKVIARHL